MRDRKPRKRLVATALVVLLLAAIAGIGANMHSVGRAGTTYSETHHGTITGTLGSIHCAPNGGNGTDNLDLQFSNLLPGAVQTVSSTCNNNGNSPEDVYVVFNNATALSALNNLGTYGEVHLKGDGNALFDSANLNDNSTTCGPFSPSGCWPLKSVYLLASNVPVGGSTSMSFGFGYASKLTTQPPAGGSAVWNTYPVAGQFTTNAGDGSGNGLPYEFVAEQVGAPAPTG